MSCRAAVRTEIEIDFLSIVANSGELLRLTDDGNNSVGESRLNPEYGTGSLLAVKAMT